MNSMLQELVREELCPNGIWQLAEVMKSVLLYEILRLPAGEVSETGTRYPQTPTEMRAFLVKFFTRHYFQVQNSLLDFMTSQDFLDITGSGHLRILDVGSGPAVASLAITDMLSCILNRHADLTERSKGGAVKLTYVLNDISSVCLGTGQRMLANYFRTRREHAGRLVKDRMVSVQKAFPENMGELQRARLYLGTYDIVVLSYVISPLSENEGFSNLINGLVNLEKLCGHSGRLLILQDKFQGALVRQMSRAVGISSYKQVLTQRVYPRRDDNETYTYTYYCCLYAPVSKLVVRRSCIV
jgi:hypothetical protein